ncbi:MAG: helix-turn-helix transcriptional regulator, partial [Erysipelotrichaceae bacterium]|nr:helix-turn-helix transcriptional regulator [Erysipelotrichaceae bacterium]
MKLMLSENIRKFRKQRGMTQEKLAEALGVTVGAVYKWESGLSQPELSMLVDIADFFDTSVDVLLGCRMKDNR